jgi:hypothetical protein
MNASRTHDSRRIDFSKLKGDALTKMRLALLRFVGGIRGERKTEVDTRQIRRWFSGTPAGCSLRDVWDCQPRDDAEVATVRTAQSGWTPPGAER